MKVQLLPAKAGEGIVFNERLKASLPYARVIDHRTCLVRGKERIEMVEHFLGACYGLGVTDLKVEVDGEEMPFGDGSALPFVQIIRRAGLKTARNRGDLTGESPTDHFRICKPLVVIQDRAFIIALPPESGLTTQGGSIRPERPSGKINLRRLRVHCLLELSGIGEQFFFFSGSRAEFEHNVAPARTFGKVGEKEKVKNVIATLSYPLSSRHGWLFPQRWRFKNEPCRHKVLDLLGDLSLLSFSIEGKIFAYQPGHKLNLMLLKRLTKEAR